MLDADQAAKAVLAPDGPAYEDVLSLFGPQILTPEGEVDRSRLAELIFSDKQARQALETLTHPHIFRKLLEMVRRRGGEHIVVVEAALLLETLDEWSGDLKPDAIVLVLSRTEDQLARLTRDRGLSEPAALARIEAQIPSTQKSRAADYVVKNSGSLAELEQSALRVWEDLKTRLRAG